VMVPDIDKLRELMRNLKKVKGVIEVYRTKN
jgi:hypothetical protein